MASLALACAAEDQERWTVGAICIPVKTNISFIPMKTNIGFHALYRAIKNFALSVRERI